MKSIISIVLAFLGISAALGQIDLVVNTSAVATTCNIQNDTLYAYARIENQGPTVVANFRVGFYLTADATTDPASDHFFGSATVGTLAGAGTTDVQIAVNLGDIAGVPNGSYYVGVYADDLFAKTETDENNNGFTMTSHNQVVFPVSLGINEEDSALKVGIYPNPGQGLITIDFGTLPLEPMTIEVYDALGQRVFYSSTNEQMSVIDLAVNDPGLLFIRFSQGRSISTTSYLLLK